MKSFLLVVDMQRDFVDGALGTPEAVAMRDRAAAKIRAFEGDILVTFDTHEEDYLDTAEGKLLPVPHCVRGTAGWELDAVIAKALAQKAYTAVEKPTFGAVSLPALLKRLSGGEPFAVELIGLCTDICVVSNALLLKAHYPDIPLRVDASCCAGVTPTAHEAALTVMQSCQIEVVGR